MRMTFTPHSDLSAGDRVTVTNGPFAEILVKYTTYRRGARVGAARRDGPGRLD